VEVVVHRDATTGRLGHSDVAESNIYDLSSQFLGGGKVFKFHVSSRLDVHAAILEGIPYASLIHLLKSLITLQQSEVAYVLGVSARTLSRQKVTPKKAMPPTLASRTWLFAETLAKATEVLGSKERAEEWMSKPAMGLDSKRPMDLLQTVQGAELVHDFLTRLEYNVYS
jgi:putative toxin-antitoxin system antitoxin component (TIGR02293 family)